MVDTQDAFIFDMRQNSHASKTSATIFNETGHTGGVSFDIFDARKNSRASKNKRACVAAPHSLDDATTPVTSAPAPAA